MTKNSENASSKQKKVNHKQQVEELTNDLKRVQAEFLNYKRRSEEDKLFAIEIGKEQAVASLLPVLDNLDRAIAHEPDDIKDHQWVKGVSSVVKQLDSQLQNIGLIKVGNIGDIFDPEMHEAISMIDGEGDEEVIVGVAQAGYKLNNRIIRHAKVQVGKK